MSPLLSKFDETPSLLRQTEELVLQTGINWFCKDFPFKAFHDVCVFSIIFEEQEARGVSSAVFVLLMKSLELCVLCSGVTEQC